MIAVCTTVILLHQIVSMPAPSVISIFFFLGLFLRFFMSQHYELWVSPLCLQDCPLRGKKTRFKWSKSPQESPLAHQFFLVLEYPKPLEM